MIFMMSNQTYQPVLHESSVISVIGSGNLGLSLATGFSKFFKVLFYNSSQEKQDPIGNDDNVTIIHDQVLLEQSSIFIIHVPIPFHYDNSPNLEYLRSALRTIRQYIKPGSFVILESTTFPGTIEKIVIPELEMSGYEPGLDFGVAYSPEMEYPILDPALPKGQKIVGGYTPDCTMFAAALYKNVFPDVLAVKDCMTAETAQNLLGTFASVNTALVNEMAIFCEQLGVSIWDVISAATAKSKGYSVFFPGSGDYNDSIPKDPYYLMYSYRYYRMRPQFFQRAVEMNEYMSEYVSELISIEFMKISKSFSNSIISFIGLENSKIDAVLSSSSSLPVIESIVNSGAEVRYYDPNIPKITLETSTIHSEKSVLDAVKNSDCMVFLYENEFLKELDLRELAGYMQTPVCIDCKNLFNPCEGIIYCGLGKG